MRIILASASPRRRELLAGAGVSFDVYAPDVDEDVRPGEGPEAYVMRVARDKVHAVRVRYPDAFVLGADTTVVVDGIVLGKPADDADARRMLTALAGRAHEVLTGVVAEWPGGAGADLARTRVWFKPLSAVEIENYIATREPRDKAGAYAIQGRAGVFVERIDGSRSNVVGLPLAIVLQLLQAAGLAPAAGRPGTSESGGMTS